MDIEILRKHYAVAEETARTLRNKLQDAEEAEKLPELKAKYEGKYFRYRNQYSGEGEKWWIYYFCRQVISSSQCIVNRFETSPDECTFKQGKECYLHSLEEQIPETVYNKELEKFKITLNKL